MAKRHRRGRPVHGILLLDKPSGGSSNQALQRAKRLYSASKAGHTGSLDPLATGMLPICFGEATKLATYLLDADKGYETTLKLGVTTHSADSDGEVVETRAVPADLNVEQFTAVCQRFTGAIKQIPPMVSAIKIDGKRLYKLAREGKEVDRPARAVTIHELEVLSFSGDTARLAVRCSKGTYIRSLVTDIGEAIGCGAHVTSLRRTFVAPFQGLPMITLDTLEHMTKAVQWEGLPATPDETSAQTCWPALDSLLLAPDAGLHHMNIVTVDNAARSAFMHGNPAACSFSAENPPAEALCRVYDESGQLIGMGDFFSSGTVSPRRVFQWG